VGGERPREPSRPLRRPRGGVVPGGPGIGIEDVETGDEAFDREFKVRAEDPAAARDLLTPDLRAFLLSVDDRLSFEIRAGWLLCWAKQLPVRELGDLHDVAWRFVAKLPASVPEPGP
jgi:hypothetical protein